MPAPRLRQAVRAVVTDPAWRVLLVHFVPSTTPHRPDGIWLCPGGGVEPGESDRAALRRELLEELGHELPEAAELGEPVWRKEHAFPLGDWDGQRDAYWWLPVEPFAPAPRLSAAELRGEGVDEVRWWTFAELQAAQRAYDAGEPGAVFSPRPLGHLVGELRRDGRPERTLVLDPL